MCDGRHGVSRDARGVVLALVPREPDTFSGACIWRSCIRQISSDSMMWRGSMLQAAKLVYEGEPHSGRLR